MPKLPSWHELPLGATIIEAGNATEYETGLWRTLRPVTDETKCISCAICWVFCPDSSRILVERKEPHPPSFTDYYYDFDAFYCKGCGICARECPTGAITMVPEER